MNSERTFANRLKPRDYRPILQVGQFAFPRRLKKILSNIQCHVHPQGESVFHPRETSDWPLCRQEIAC
jgi:hypothetical protein